VAVCFCSEGPAILNWLTVLMEPVERSDLEIPTHVDPREAYVAQIFTPGRFSTLAILKACNVSISVTRKRTTTFSGHLRVF